MKISNQVNKINLIYKNEKQKKKMIILQQPHTLGRNCLEEDMEGPMINYTCNLSFRS